MLNPSDKQKCHFLSKQCPLRANSLKILAKQLSSIRVYYTDIIPARDKSPCLDKQHAVTPLLRSCDHACMHEERAIDHIWASSP